MTEVIGVDHRPGSPEHVPDQQPVKTAELATANLSHMLAESRLSADELEEALQVVAERRLQKAQDAAALAEATSTDGFQHFFLANPKYPYERVLVPGTRGTFWMFYRGRMLIDSALKEAVVRQACAGRVYDEDLTEPRKCKVCQTLWFSTAAHAECQLGH